MILLLPGAARDARRATSGEQPTQTRRKHDHTEEVFNQKRGKEDMITPKQLLLKVNLRQGSQDLAFTAHHLVCSGWVGRDPRALQAHIDELAELGIPAPTRVPIYMNLSTYLLTTEDEITVVSDQSSGEIEYVLLRKGGETWVTVGQLETSLVKNVQKGEPGYAGKVVAANGDLLIFVNDIDIVPTLASAIDRVE